MLGNYSDEVTVLGTIGQITLGVVGADLPADVRDLTYDITNWEWSLNHLIQSGLDVIAFAPGIGVIKNVDEISDAIKGVGKYGDEAVSVGKQAAKNVDVATKGVSKYSPNSSGYFGNPGKNGKSGVRNMNGGNATAVDFFNEKTKGYTSEKNINGGGIVRKLSDGTDVTYRPSSTSDGTPAVDINGGSTFKTQKIHFIP